MVDAYIKEKDIIPLGDGIFKLDYLGKTFIFREGEILQTLIKMMCHRKVICLEEEIHLCYALKLGKRKYVFNYLTGKHKAKWN